MCFIVRGHDKPTHWELRHRSFPGGKRSKCFEAVEFAGFFHGQIPRLSDGCGWPWYVVVASKVFGVIPAHIQRCIQRTWEWWILILILFIKRIVCVILRCMWHARIEYTYIVLIYIYINIYICIQTFMYNALHSEAAHHEGQVGRPSIHSCFSWLESIKAMEQRCIWSSDRCEWVMNCEKLLGFITPEQVANQQSTMTDGILFLESTDIIHQHSPELSVKKLQQSSGLLLSPKDQSWMGKRFLEDVPFLETHLWKVQSITPPAAAPAWHFEAFLPQSIGFP